MPWKPRTFMALLVEGVGCRLERQAAVHECTDHYHRKRNHQALGNQLIVSHPLIAERAWAECSTTTNERRHERVGVVERDGMTGASS